MPSLDTNLEGTVPPNCSPSGSPLVGGSECVSLFCSEDWQMVLRVLYPFLRVTFIHVFSEENECAFAVVWMNWSTEDILSILSFLSGLFCLFVCFVICWTAVVQNKCHDSSWVCCREKEESVNIIRTRTEFLFSHFTLLRDYFIVHEKIYCNPKNIGVF